MLTLTSVTVTPQAATKLQEILVEEGQPNGALRIIVVPNGHGAQYMLALEEEVKEDDLIVADGPVKVISDTDSAPLLEGAEIDYADGLMRSGFVIHNPNIATSGHGGCACGGNCGCGGH
ncbi:MAG: iron-sulfur cluster assembly accessory protein [SAR202 cluster bacterium]|nr:iron-sulfur cluster assembly accessory protein [SAR202 cluster bacterium]